MKQCKTCSIEKPLSEYRKKENGLQPSCKSCCNKAYIRAYYAKDKSSWIKYANKKKQWAIANPEEAKLENKKRYAARAEKQKAQKKEQYTPELGRARNLFSKYKITIDEFETLKLSQNNCCAICRISLVNENKPHVDHSHKTGKIRGILCHLCNPGLGMFKDSIEILQAAQDYLKKYI